jgi:hypothetical protein
MDWSFVGVWRLRQFIVASISAANNANEEKLSKEVSVQLSVRKQ